jgi:Protein of unknown function (DUF3631)
MSFEDTIPDVDDAPEGEGAELLDDLAAFLRRFIAFPSKAAGDATALWVVHTHAFDASETSPYLAITSPEKQSGKTRVLDTLELLARRPWRVVTPSEAVIFRTVQDRQPALLLDETDAIFGKDALAVYEGLRAILNVGNRRGATVPRCEMHGQVAVVVDFNVYCPKALAGIGRLPDTIADRAIPIRMQRRARGEQVERFRYRDASADAEPLRDRATAWAKTNLDALTAARPDVPDALTDRAQDAWEPLLAIADLASRGWPARARAAAISLHGADTGTDETDGVLLLTHIRDAFADTDRLPTAALLQTLVDRDDGPWAEWWGKDVDDGKTKGPAARLGKLLKPYGIHPAQLWLRGGKVRGYERAAFTEMWDRYLDPPPAPQEGQKTVETVGGSSGQRADQHPTVPTVQTPSTEGGGHAASVWRCDRCGAERTTDLTGFLHGGCGGHFQPVGAGR